MDPLVEGARHCAWAGCGREDFLPFKCDACSRAFCLTHRAYEAHDCPNAAGRSSEVMVCPLCAHAVRFVPGQDPNATWEAHRASGGCVEADYKRVHRKPKCCVKGCKERLDLTNRISCKSCGALTCMRHRFADQHACGVKHSAIRRDGVPAARREPSAATAGAAASRHGSASSAGTVKAFFSSRPKDQRGQQRPRAQQGPTQGASTNRLRAGPRPSPGGAERCPQCAATFRTVTDLIAHVEAAHAEGASGSRATQGRPVVRASTRREVCPECGLSFATLDRLIAHAEAKHGQASDKGSCVVS